jgi:hypothetical protein
MSRWIWVGFGLLIVVIAVMAWRSRTEVDALRIAQGMAQNDAASKSATPSTSSDRSTSPTSTPTMTAPPGEPPEDVLLRFQKDEYDEITRAGGMKVTVTASGHQILLKPKLYSGRKDYCRPVPREPEGSYECGLSLIVTLREGDNQPGQHGERQFVHWDGVAGEWKRGLANDRQRRLR